jgi:hypothetical protein
VRRTVGLDASVRSCATGLGLAALLLGAACTGMAGRRITADGSPPATATVAPTAASPAPRTSDTGSRWLPPDPVGQVSVETLPLESPSAPGRSPDPVRVRTSAGGAFPQAPPPPPPPVAPR